MVPPFLTRKSPCFTMFPQKNCHFAAVFVGARHGSRSGAELGDMYNGFADGLARQGKFEPMALAPPRPDVTTLCPQSMTFAPAHQKDPWDVIFILLNYYV